MSDNAKIKVNDDGTVTRLDGGSLGNTPDNGNSGNDNSNGNSWGCCGLIVVIVIIAVIIGIVVKSSGSKDSDIDTPMDTATTYVDMPFAGVDTTAIQQPPARHGKYAVISRVWERYNVSVGGTKGMEIHVTFDVSGMKNKRVYIYANFYYGDNRTALKDPYGKRLCLSYSDISPYEDTTFEDVVFFMPYDDLNFAPGFGSVSLSYDIVIKTKKGKVLSSKKNNGFELHEN